MKLDNTQNKTGGIKLCDVIKRKFQSFIQAFKTKWFVYIPIGLTLKVCVLHAHTHTHTHSIESHINNNNFLLQHSTTVCNGGTLCFPRDGKESSCKMPVNFIFQRLITDILAGFCLTSVITKLQVRMLISLKLLLLLTLRLIFLLYFC